MNLVETIPFQVNRTQQGEYRIYLNLTRLEDKALKILQLAATLGFDKPQFVSDRNQVFAILFREFHQYEDDPDVLFGHLEDKTVELWEACEPEAELKLTISSRFKKQLESIAV